MRQFGLSIDSKIDDLERYSFSENFARFHIFRTQQQLNECRPVLSAPTL